MKVVDKNNQSHYQSFVESKFQITNLITCSKEILNIILVQTLENLHTKV